MEDVLDNLNDEQLQAVTSTEGCIRVIAGAGSGKTRALTHRFAYLVNELGIRPGNILCITFTNKAAGEMRNRIHQLTGDNDTGYICTFHSFCVSVLQEDSHVIAYPKSFLVLDNGDIDEMLRMIYDERGLTLRDKTFAAAREMFEMRKSVQEPQYYQELIQMSSADLHQKYLDAEETDDILFYGYLYQQKKCFGLDYNDLIFMTLHIFNTFPDIELKWQKRLQYIMIDEFQDIDPPQYELMRHLCGYHHNLFIVGDPDQTIYTWRGARPGYILHFDQAFEQVQTIMMNTNYRSTPEILDAANSLISHNHDRIEKDLKAVNPNGMKAVCYHAESPQKEAQWICNEILRLREEGNSFGDIVVLYRAHYVSRTIEEAFLQAEIPYHIYSGVQFFDRTEIKDALCYLRMIAFQDDLSFMRIANVPKRNLGRKRMQFLQQYADEKDMTLFNALKENADTELFANTKSHAFINLIDSFAERSKEKTVSEVLSAVLDESGYEKLLRTEGAQDRLDDLAELKQSVYEWETTAGEETDLSAYLKHIALFTNADLPDQKEKVKMMTVHSAKGLQFPYVFLCSLTEGIFPSRKVRTEEGMEEERRLAFVAVTRAEKGLFLSDAAGRSFNDTARYPSRFLLDIDPDCLDWVEKPDETYMEKARKNIEYVSSRLNPDMEKAGLHEGQRVRHRVFGDGTIMKIDMDQEEIVIKFDSLDTPRSIAMHAAKKLQKIEMS